MTKAMESGKIAVTSDASLVIGNDLIDVVIDATGVPAVGAEIGLRAMEHGKHLVMMNVEADVTIGAYLKSEADRLGVTYSLGAGDEPSSCMELIEFVSAMGHPIVAAGKGKNNPLNIDATPPDYEEEAERRHMNVRMLVEFVDGSKTMVEMAAIANATGLVPDKPGMHGPAATLGELHKTFWSRRRTAACCRRSAWSTTRSARASRPASSSSPTCRIRASRERMEDLKMGKGPYFTFHRPYHLTSLEVPLTCARVVLYGKADMVPLAKPVAEVCAVAKKDLEARRDARCDRRVLLPRLDHDRAEARAAKAIPCGLLQGGSVTAPIKKGELITYANAAPAPGIEDRASSGRARTSSSTEHEAWPPPGSSPTPRRSPTCPSPTGTTAPSSCREVLRKMYLIRRFEEGAEDSYTRGLIHGTMHLSIGQEASAMGICMPLTADDQITSTHRGHGHCIAKGADVEADVRRVLRQGRPATARAAAARCTSPTSRWAISAPTASSPAAFRSPSARRCRAKRMKTGKVVVSFFGDGANNEGAFHEALNMASIWKLPVDLRLREQRLRHVDLHRALDGGEEHRRPRRAPIRCRASS